MNTTIVRTASRRRVSEQRILRDVDEARTQVRAVAFSTGLQWMAIAWSDRALQGVVFGHASRRLAEGAVSRVCGSPQHVCRIVTEGDLDGAPQWVRQLIDDLKRFADGEPIDFSDVPISQAHLTPFGRRVIGACRRIGWGRTSSYGELAAQCGAPGAARAVGSVMAKNRYPLVVPCHRVLGASGKLGGYSAPGGLQRKKELLAKEGCGGLPVLRANN